MAGGNCWNQTVYFSDILKSETVISVIYIVKEILNTSVSTCTASLLVNTKWKNTFLHTNCKTESSTLTNSIVYSAYCLQLVYRMGHSIQPVSLWAHLLPLGVTRQKSSNPLKSGFKLILNHLTMMPVCLCGHERGRMMPMGNKFRLSKKAKGFSSCMQLKSFYESQ